MRRELHVWQWVWWRQPAMAGQPMAAGWREIYIGLIRFKSFPNEGVEVSKRHYDGKLWHFYLWLPWERA